jgi:CAAX protease family protein
MSDRVLGTITILAIFTVGMIVAAIFQRGKFNRLWFVLTLGAYGLYEGGYWLGTANSVFSFFRKARWNWDGKIYATLVLLTLILVLKGVSFRSVGLTLKQEPGWRLAWFVIFVLCVGFVYAALKFPPVSFDGDWEALAFQLTMPSIDEELFFRGLLVVMIDQTFGVSKRILGAPFGWGGVLTSLMFGMIHGVDFDDGVFNFATQHALYTGFGGLVLYWLRARTGSLMAPVFVHSFGNSIFLVI